LWQIYSQKVTLAFLRRWLQPLTFKM